ARMLNLRRRTGPLNHLLQASALGVLAGVTLACSKDAEGTSGPATLGTVTARAAPSPPSASPPASSAAPPTSAAELEPPAPAKASPNGAITVQREGRPVPAARALKILHFGDSMVPLVGNYLRPRFQAQGGHYEIASTSSSSTLSWAEGAVLRETLAKHDPELVLISLGSNELYFVDDLAQRAQAIQSIVREIGDRACLWIGPPSWAKARGFLDTLEANLGSCSYFDSAKLPMERQADGRHPTWGASHAWANQVWQRLGGEGAVAAQ
ncbi:MAG TPA: SGNH/GDSL hydrolase family protein, partial [Polyangiales bacterium]